MPPRRTLVLTHMDGSVRTFDIGGEKAEYLLGREVEGQNLEPAVPLLANSASRKHAKISMRADGIFVEDLKSTHGTYLDGHRLEPAVPYLWKEGSTLQFGLDQLEGFGSAGYETARHMSRGKVVEEASKLRGVKRSWSEVATQQAASSSRGPDQASEEGGSEPGSKSRRTTLGAQSAAAARSAAASSGQGRSAQPGKPAAGAGRFIGPTLPNGAANGQAASACSGRQTATAGTSRQKGADKCDKCDGPHPTDACPHFKKDREGHKDAWVNYGQKKPVQMGTPCGSLFIRHAQIMRQPGDGSCMFHSLCYGLGWRNGAWQLRQELSQFVGSHPKVEIGGDTLEEWVRWDSNISCKAYANRMSRGGSWGGAIEMAACSLLKKVNVHVYERKGGGFQRITCFDQPGARKTLHILYQGRAHYDALVLHGR